MLPNDSLLTGTVRRGVSPSRWDELGDTERFHATSVRAVQDSCIEAVGVLTGVEAALMVS